MAGGLLVGVGGHGFKHPNGGPCIRIRLWEGVAICVTERTCVYVVMEHNIHPFLKIGARRIDRKSVLDLSNLQDTESSCTTPTPRDLFRKSR